MRHLPLGRQGLVTSQHGLGCMGMSEFCGPGEEADMVARKAVARKAMVTGS